MLGFSFQRGMTGEIRPKGTSHTPHTKNTPLNPLSRGESSKNSPLERGLRGVFLRLGFPGGV